MRGKAANRRQPSSIFLGHRQLDYRNTVSLSELNFCLSKFIHVRSSRKFRYGLRKMRSVQRLGRSNPMTRGTSISQPSSKSYQEPADRLRRLFVVGRDADSSRAGPSSYGGQFRSFQQEYGEHEACQENWLPNVCWIGRGFFRKQVDCSSRPRSS